MSPKSWNQIIDESTESSNSISNDDQCFYDEVLLILLEVIHQKAFDEGTTFINAFKILFRAKEIESKPGENDMIQMTFEKFSYEE